MHAAAAGSGSRGGRDAGGASVTASPATAAASSRPDQAGAPQLVWAEGANNILSLNEYRRGVGLCIYRPRDGLVFAARRVDDPLRSWQMPQVRAAWAGGVWLCCCCLWFAAAAVIADCSACSGAFADAQ